MEPAMVNPYRLLQVALALFGVVALLLYPLSVVWPSGWAWHAGAPYDSQYFMMIVGIYIVIGVFLLMAARKPEANTSFIWFAVWSSLVHAVIMAVQSVGHGHHRGHLWGDVPALLAVAVILTILVRAADLERLEPAASS
jgi:FtsH-binding integral membrane protein